MGACEGGGGTSIRRMIGEDTHFWSSANAGGGGGTEPRTSFPRGVAAGDGSSGNITPSTGDFTSNPPLTSWLAEIPSPGVVIPSSITSSSSSWQAMGAAELLSAASGRFSSLESDGSRPPKSSISRNSVATRDASFSKRRISASRRSCNSSSASCPTPCPAPSPNKATPSSRCRWRRSISRSRRAISSIWRHSSSEHWPAGGLWII